MTKARDRRVWSIIARISLFVGAAAMAAAVSRPLPALLAIGAMAAAYAVGRFPGMLALGAVTVALGSSSIPLLKETGLVVRWPAIVLLATVPLLEPNFRPLRLRGVTKPVVAFIVFAIISCAWSAAAPVTLAKTLSLAIVFWVGFAVAPAALADAACRRSAAKWLAWVGAIGAIVAICVGVAAPATGRPLGPLQGWLENSNGIGLWVAALLPTVLVLRSRTAVVLALPMVVSLVWSQSRSALLSLGLLCFLALWRKRPKLARTLAAAVVTAVLVGVTGIAHSALAETSLGKFYSSGGPIIALTGARSEAWSLTAGLIARAPIEGLGFGSAEAVFELKNLQLEFVYFKGNNPNNAYLQVLMESGLIGLLIFATLIGTLFTALWKGRHDRTRLALGGVGVVLLLSGVVESLLLSSGGPYAILTWPTIAAAVAGLTAPAQPRVVAARLRRLAREQGVAAQRVAAATPVVVVLFIVLSLTERYQVILDRPSNLVSATVDGLPSNLVTVDGLVGPHERAALLRAAELVPQGDTYIAWVPELYSDARYRLYGGSHLYLSGRIPVAEYTRAEWLLAYADSGAAAGLPVRERHDLGAGLELVRLREAAPADRVERSP